MIVDIRRGRPGGAPGRRVATGASVMTVCALLGLLGLAATDAGAPERSEPAVRAAAEFDGPLSPGSGVVTAVDGVAAAELPEEPHGEGTLRPITLPESLAPGEQHMVVVPGVPDGAVAAVVRVDVRGDGAAASTRDVVVRLTGPDRDRVVFDGGPAPVVVEAAVSGFVVPAPGETVDPASWPSIVVCYLDPDQPSPTPVPGPTAVPAPAPTPVPAPSSPPTAQLSSKKGVASYAYLSSDVAKVAALKPSWSYNWSASQPADMAGIEFVPMVWGAGVDDATVDALRQGARTGRFSTLLAFNEPDLREQANMSPQQALELWPRLQSTGLRLVSPAPANPWNGWLDAFMAGAAQRGYRVDAVALHFYQDFTNPGAVADLEGQLRAIHAKYGRPIWITEIGAIDLSAWGMRTHSAPTHERADAYMRQVGTLLESLPFVERYAWFDDNCWHAVECRYSSLYDDRHNLTSHGTVYAGINPGLLAPAASAALHPVPGVVQAEAFTAMSGLQQEPTSDVGGGANLGWADGGDWADYQLDVRTDGVYRVTVRVASPGGAPGALRLISARSSAAVSVPATGGWQTWTDVTTTVRLDRGTQRLRLHVDAPGWNVNAFRVHPL